MDVRPAIRRAYRECLGSPHTFQVNFEKKMSTLMRTSYWARYNYDAQKIISDLRIIGNECKRRGYATSRFLQLVAKYWERADRRLHRRQVLNRETLLLEWYIGEVKRDDHLN